MDFIDKLQALASRIEKQKDRIETEEATKQAFILPFIQILGYDIWNPDEVVPEFVADVGIKKGEKIDYAILQDGKPIMLMEAKKAGAPLNLNHSSQLFRYFHVCEARVAVLTNGIHYQFFTDVDEPNKMDTKPFLELDMLNLKENAVAPYHIRPREKSRMSSTSPTTVPPDPRIGQNRFIEPGNWRSCSSS